MDKKKLTGHLLWVALCWLCSLVPLNARSSATHVGDLYYNDLLLSKNLVEAGEHEQAREILYRLSKLKNPYAAWAAGALGRMYQNGEGVEQDIDRARQHFRRSAALGSSDGVFSLAYTYVDSDFPKYVKGLKKAAYMGHVISAGELGLLHFKGEGVPQDDLKAYFWLFSKRIRSEDSTIAWSEAFEALEQRMRPEDIEMGRVLAWNQVYLKFRAGYFQDQFDADNPNIKGPIQPGGYEIRDGRLIIDGAQ